MKNKATEILSNERGAGLIAVVIGITTAVLSYSAYTASSYVLMMTESKRQKRLSVGYEAIHQLAKTLELARQRDADQVAQGTNDCSLTPGLFKVGNFCMTATNCIENPLDANQDICFATTTTGLTPTVEVAVVDRTPSVFQKIIDPVQDMNLWYGERAFNVAKAVVAQAPVAQAVVRKIFIPDLPAAIPIVTFDSGANAAVTTACPAGAAPRASANLCIHCVENTANTSGDARAACMRLKVCIRNISIGGTNPFACDPANDGQWLWQSVAVTAPLVEVP